MPLYFAYGANMDRAAMAARCPGSKPLGTARLVRHRFLITREGYASVARDPRRTVWGLLWDLALTDVPALDRYESVARGLYGKLIQPVLSEGGTRRALIYVARDGRPGAPLPGYLEGVVAAASELGLPPDYVQEIGAWSPGAKAAPAPAAPMPKVRPLWSLPPAVQDRKP